MPRRNRVTPFGRLTAVAEKGRFLGNRGDLLWRDGSIRHDFPARETRWICCRLEPGGFPPIAFDTPGRYTPLFFADEAVALAAGHRPCVACRRPAYLRFVEAWRRAHGLDAATPVRAGDIDRALDAARLDGTKKRTHGARWGTLPDGAFVTRDGAPEVALLVHRGAARPWTPGGYGAAIAVPGDETVTVLTPAPTLAVLAAGYRPEVAIDEA